MRVAFKLVLSRGKVACKIFILFSKSGFGVELRFWKKRSGRVSDQPDNAQWESNLAEEKFEPMLSLAGLRQRSVDPLFILKLAYHYLDGMSPAFMPVC